MVNSTSTDAKLMGPESLCSGRRLRRRLSRHRAQGDREAGPSPGLTHAAAGAGRSTPQRLRRTRRRLWVQCGFAGTQKRARPTTGRGHFCARGGWALRGRRARAHGPRTAVWWGTSAWTGRGLQAPVRCPPSQGLECWSRRASRGII